MIRNPGSGRTRTVKRHRLQIFLQKDTFAVVEALAAQRRHSLSRTANALIEAALREITNGAS